MPDLGEPLKRQVELAVDEEWRSAKTVWRRIGEWAPRTVKRALYELALEGRIEKRTVPWRNGTPKGEYRRPVAAK